MKSLAALKPKDAPEELLRYHLHKKLAGMEPARTTKRVHASDVTKDDFPFCPREYALLDLTKKTRKDEFLSTSLQVTFRIGRDLQEYVVELFAELDQAIGNWNCAACGTKHEFCMKPKGCKTCGCKAFLQEEYRFKSEVSGISCGVDMFWNHNSPVHTIVEIKSIDKEKFKELAAPLAEHKLRTNLYMRLVDESIDPMKTRVRTDRAKILYISKGGFGCADDTVTKWGFADNKFSPFKEFWVERDDSQTDAMHNQALRLEQFRKQEKGMPAGICKTSYGNRAVRCSCLKECFSGSYPPVEELTN